MPLSERNNVVFRHKLCYNCLCPGHQVRLCRSTSYLKCNKRHHTKLHDGSSGRLAEAVASNSPTNDDHAASSVVVHATHGNVPLEQH